MKTKFQLKSQKLESCAFPHEREKLIKITLSEEKKSAKNDKFFYQWRILFSTVLFTDDYFYWRLIFTDEYSYRQFFHKQEHLVFSNLKIPLVNIFDFIFDQNFLRLNLARDQCFFIHLMFSDSQAKKLIGKMWRIILPMIKFFTDYFFLPKFYDDFFSSDRVLVTVTA